MLRKHDLDEISDDDFISEKQIYQGTNKTILSVESVQVVKGIDKNIKKKIEEGKICLNDISAVKNAEIEEAFLRSLPYNILENNTKELNKEMHISNKKEECDVENRRTDNIEEVKGICVKDSEDCVSVTTLKSSEKKRDINKREDTDEGEETKMNDMNDMNDMKDMKDMKDSWKYKTRGKNFSHSLSTSDLCNKYDIQELKHVLKRETVNCINKKKRKMEKKRLNANLEALRLQYIPINSDKFIHIPREIKENILALFSCIIVKHIDSFDDDEVQNHLDDLSKKFLRQLADLLSIESLAYQSIIKPFEQRKRIREMTGDKTFYELYEKPFIDNLLLRINELQPDIDLKFKNVVEELNNELDFWQSDDPETACEDGVAENTVVDELVENELKDKEHVGDIGEMDEMGDMKGNELGQLKEKSISYSNVEEDYNKDNTNSKEDSKKMILEKSKPVTDTYVKMQSMNNCQHIKGENDDLVFNLIKQENERNMSVDEDSNNFLADSDTDMGLNENDRVFRQHNVVIDSEYFASSEAVNSEGEKQKIKKEIGSRVNSGITVESLESGVKSGECCKSKSTNTSESYYESDIEKHLNHGVPTKSPEAKSVLLRDLITTYIMTGNNNARIQLYFQKFAKCLKINELLILRIEENLAADLINALQASINETSKKKKIRRIKIAFAALGGGALIAFTAGLAAPGIIAGLTALGAGGSSLTAFLASASGVAFIVSLFGAGGAGLTGYKYSKRIANIKTFEFIMLNGNISKSLSVCVCISGEIKTDDDITKPWLEVFPNCYCDLYCLKWENHLLQTLGSLIETMLSQEFAITASKIWLQYTVASALSFSLTWPLALIKYAANLDNAYLLLRERAQQAGRILAEALSDKNTVGQRPVILIGYSMGARVIFYCLKYLHSKKLYNIVSNAIFIGLPATTNVKVWNNIRMVVTNRIVNVYSKNDWLLGFLYRYMEWKINVAGLTPVNAPYVENYDVSGIVTSHLDYKLKLKDIFNLIDFDM